MKEVYILWVTYAADWPHKGGEIMQGVYASMDSVFTKIDSLKNDIMVTDFRWKCVEVKP